MNTTEIAVTSICIETITKTVNKHRDAPPLNVYLRIRPFISDELERSENQKLIDIIDEKHVAVKLYPTINNTIRTLQTSYNEYEVTQIFDDQCKQKELFEQILAQPTNEIFTGSNLLLCTLGLTNSGKTHTMFGTADEPGLIPNCLHRIFLNVGSNIDEKVLFKPIGLENLMPTIDCDLNMEVAVRNYIFKDEKQRMRLPKLIQQQNAFEDLSIEDERYSIWISFFELYNENIVDLLVQPKDMKMRKNLRLMQNEHSTIIKNLIQIPVFDLKEAEDIIKFGLVNRSTSKTNLNEASSRSHAVLCITLITTNEFDEEPNMSHMYICDLAGNEPVNGTGKQLTETCNINTSLMTFKDCIRVLNENQSAKKQMLVPYRNSVLTSIFRPFFVGRGRTIICCNINPCATFITQTNDLLKFCALAQKTIIMPVESKHSCAVIRQQRKSKNKAPKRLGRHSTLKTKHGKPINDNDEIEELDVQTIDGATLIIPTNTKSLNFWKYCAKQALELLQKQASTRRTFMIERHQERVQTVNYLLDQRQQIDTLVNEKQSLVKQNEILLKDIRLEQDKHNHTQQLYNNLILNEKQYHQKLLKLEKQSYEKNLHSHEEMDSLKKQLQTVQQQFERLTNEHIKTIEQNDQDKRQCQEREQHLQDDNQRLKRDLGLELYRKQDAEKKVRMLEDKLRNEQTQYQKVQYDFIQTNHDLKTLQVKFDALKIEINEIYQNEKMKLAANINMYDAKTSTTTINEEQPITKRQKRSIRSKRRTNDENQHEQEIKQPKRVTRSRSTASTDATYTLLQQLDEPNISKKSKQTIRNVSTSTKTHIPVLMKQTRKKAQDDQTDSKVKPKTASVRGRPKKKTIETPPASIQPESHSPLYATIQRDTSLDGASFATVAVNSSAAHATPSKDKAHITPKPSTFKRIQSFFRATPTLTNSTKVNRVVQVKTTAVAFGSSTPTNRMPPSILKTPGPTILPTPNTSNVQNIATPKSKYNLRTRLFNHPTSKDEDEIRSQTKTKPRTRK
ncbi:unnamed protein product [Rotaria socialis]|uniref:Kinesin motor domain-containing protein n=1 Tax=Rotaria socialis TaxID=392032 RepID=A0A818E0P1_9BILA|nr:unnamed protein product [Rotaria socialis]CAF4452126.1 unnamed protein product [Rotaria socialis]